MSVATHTPAEVDRSAWQRLIAIQIVAFSILGAFSAFSQRYLFADGSLFFLGLLKNRKVADFFPARYYAHVLTELPTVVLLEYFGLRDIKIAGLVFGLTLFLTPVFGLAIVWWAGRKAPVQYLIFPILSFSILYLNGSMLSFVEVYQATWLFWCILFLLAFSEELTITRSIFLIAFGVLSTRTYESYLLLAWPIVYVAWKRAIKADSEGNRGETIVCMLSGLLAIFSAAVSLYSTVFPFDATNRQNFSKSFAEHLQYVPVQFSLLVIFGVLWLMLLNKRQIGDFYWAVVVGYGLVVAMIPFLGWQQNWSLQYLSRVQALYVPMIFGSIVALNPKGLSDFGAISTDRQSNIWRLAALTCVVALVFQSGATLRWNKYRSSVLQEMAKNRGIPVYVESGNRSTEFDWGWAMPPFSVCLSALNFNTVSATIANPDSNGWQPFDPHKPSQMPNLKDYGIDSDVNGPRMEIVKAEYGAGDIQKDVTNLLQKYVGSTWRIELVSPSYNDIFQGDPVYNTRKLLKIQYKVNDVPSEVLLEENASIVLPPSDAIAVATQ